MGKDYKAIRKSFHKLEVAAKKPEKAEESVLEKAASSVKKRIRKKKVEE